MRCSPPVPRARNTITPCFYFSSHSVVLIYSVHELCIVTVFSSFVSQREIHELDFWLHASLLPTVATTGMCLLNCTALYRAHFTASTVTLSLLPVLFSNMLLKSLHSSELVSEVCLVVEFALVVFTCHFCFEKSQRLHFNSTNTTNMYQEKF